MNIEATDVKGVLETKIDTTAIEVNLIRADLKKINTRLQTAEDTIQTLTSQNKELAQQVKHLQRSSETMATRIEDQEGRSRRNNIRITGVPEKMEGPSVELFVEKLIIEGLQPRGLSKMFTVERAHRVPGKPPIVGTPPRTIIARIFNYRDRDTILQAARVAPPVKCDNATVSWYPDFTLQVQQQRREFLEVKKALRQQELRYAMLFPARLRVVADDKVHFFLDPGEAWQWLENRDPQKKRSPTKGGITLQERRQRSKTRRFDSDTVNEPPQRRNSRQNSPREDQDVRTEWDEVTT